MPDFDYRLSVYHGDLSLVPGLDAWLRTVLGDAIFKCGTKTLALALTLALAPTLTLHPALALIPKLTLT